MSKQHKDFVFLFPLATIGIVLIRVSKAGSLFNTVGYALIFILAIFSVLRLLGKKDGEVNRYKDI